MLEVCDVQAQYGNGFVALHSITTFVTPGEIVVVCGPNGAGKSTLLSILAGDLKPVSGQVYLDNRPLSKYTTYELSSRRAVLEQSPRAAAPFIVGKLVSLAVHVSVDPSRCEAIVQDALSDVGLEDQKLDRIDQLSGGQRHRAHLARVIAQLRAGDTAQPQYLLLDEPTASLDLVHQVAIMRVVRKIAALGIGVLVVLHDLNLAAAFADRICLLKNGRVVSDSAPNICLTQTILSDVYEAPIDVSIGSHNDIRITPLFGLERDQQEYNLV